MKKMMTIAISFLMVIGFCISCASNTQIQRTPNECYLKEEHIEGVIQKAKERGFLTEEELGYGISLSGSTYGNWEGPLFWKNVINYDLLPHKGLLYLALEKDDYRQAEVIRLQWIKYLEVALSQFDKWGDNWNKATLIKQKLETPGLTDEITLTLRKELTIAIKDKKWDDAQKIQNIITGRLNELAMQQRRIEKASSEGGQTTIGVQQPPTQHITVEQIPRYVATDIGRAISILDGKGGRLDPKAEGTLRLMDIFLKR